MIRLTTLGKIELRSDSGVSIESVIRQPRRFALLCYLAVESRRGFVRRDRILALFWPESAQEKARNALSQQLYHLRQSLGEDLVTNRGSEEIQLDLTRFECDVCVLLDRIEADDPETALRLYGGEPLPGFYVTGAPEWETWLDHFRGQVRRIVTEAAWNAAAGAAARGDTMSAITAARRAAEIAESDETAIYRLMQFLSHQGDRAGALEAYDGLVRQLEREGDAPAEYTQRLASEIREATSAPPELTPIPAAPVAAEVPVAAAAADVVYRADAAVARGWRAEIRRYALALRSLAVSGVLMFGIISLWGLTKDRGPAAPAFSGEALVVVERAEGLSEIGAVLTSSVVHELDNVSLIDVVPASDLPASRARHDAEFRLRTTVSGEPGGTQANVTVVDIETGRSIGSTRVDVTSSTTASLDRLARQIAAFARRAVGDELDRRRARVADVSENVVVAYNGAKRLQFMGDSLHRIEQREVARVQLATADSLFASAEKEARSWIELPLARAELAVQRMWAHMLGRGADLRLVHRILAEGITHADRAIKLDDDNARAYELRGVLGFYLAAVSTNSAETLARANADLSRATQLDPNSAKAWEVLSAILYNRGEFAEAYVAADKAYAADRFMDKATTIQMRLFWSALETGNAAGAARWCERISSEEPDSWVGKYCELLLDAWTPAPAAGGLERAQRVYEAGSRSRDVVPTQSTLDGAYAVVLARYGRAAEAREIADRLENSSDPHALQDVAWIHAVLGDTTRARATLDRYFASAGPAGSGAAKSSRFTFYR